MDDAAAAAAPPAPRKSAKRERTATTTEVAIDGVYVKQQQFGPTGPRVGLDAMRRRFERPQEECWGCTHEFDGRPDAVESVRVMWDLFVRNKGTMCDDRLYDTLERTFDQLIRRPLEEEGKRAPTWPAHLIRLHLTQHIVDELSSTIDRAKATRHVVDTLMSTLFRKSTETGELEADPKSHELVQGWLRTESTLLSNLRQLRGGGGGGRR
jgi:hypothetical protein